MIVDIPEIPVNISTSDTDAVEVVSVDLLIVWPFKFKGSPFNFDAENFGDNKVVQTILNHVDVTIHRKSKEDVDLYVRRSFSDHLWAWIKDSSRFI